MSKSGYELRAGLLGQAEGILAARYHSKFHEIELAIKHNIISAKDARWPSYPTTDDIVAQAEVLLAFVNNKG
tara:strand:- start:2359 stop:2574 length:216 start_codon:yes stop_codon:yes gene_type:complete